MNKDKIKQMFDFVYNEFYNKIFFIFSILYFGKIINIRIVSLLVK